MERIQSMVQYTALLAENKKRFTKIDSNCMMLRGSVARRIETGRLYSQKYEGGLCFFSDERQYFELYYAWDREASLPDLRQDRPVIISEASGNDRCRTKFLAAGFHPMRVNELYERGLAEQGKSVSDQYAQSMYRLTAAGIRLEPCVKECWAAQTAELWLTSLETGDVAEDHLRFPPAENETVLCALNGSDEVVGAYWWYINGQNAEGRHVVTRQDCFRKGIGSALLLRCMIELQERDIKRLTTWINKNNDRSIALHEGLGFYATGRSVKQYILEGD